MIQEIILSLMFIGMVGAIVLIFRMSQKYYMKDDQKKLSERLHKLD